MISGVTHADMKYYPADDVMFSLPNNIDQREYHRYVIECPNLLSMYPPEPILQSVRNHGVLVGLIRQFNKEAIIQYLRKKNSPAAQRLIQDIKKGVTATSLMDY